MIIVWIVVSLMAWYGVGLLGSTIGLTSIRREFNCDWEDEDKTFGCKMALGGLINFMAAFICALQWKRGIHCDWGWLIGGIKK